MQSWERRGQPRSQGHQLPVMTSMRVIQLTDGLKDARCGRLVSGAKRWEISGAITCVSQAKKGQQGHPRPCEHRHAPLVKRSQVAQSFYQVLILTMQCLLTKHRTSTAHEADPLRAWKPCTKLTHPLVTIQTFARESSSRPTSQVPIALGRHRRQDSRDASVYCEY